MPAHHPAHRLRTDARALWGFTISQLSAATLLLLGAESRYLFVAVMLVVSGAATGWIAASVRRAADEVDIVVRDRDGAARTYYDAERRAADRRG